MVQDLPMEIQRVKFGIFSPDDIRRLSVAQIITADTYDEDGLPIDSGLMDGRLGTIEPSRRCKTCGNRVGDCPGHFGHIELARPIIHEGFTKLIQRVLRATCRQCGKLLVPDLPTIQKDLRSAFIRAKPSKTSSGTKLKNLSREILVNEKENKITFVIDSSLMAKTPDIVEVIVEQLNKVEELKDVKISHSNGTIVVSYEEEPARKLQEISEGLASVTIDVEEVRSLKLESVMKKLEVDEEKTQVKILLDKSLMAENAVTAEMVANQLKKRFKTASINRTKDSVTLDFVDLIENYTQKMLEYEQTWGKLSESLGKTVAKIAAKSSACPYCQSVTRKIKLEKPTTFYEQTEEGNFRVTPVDIRDRFERIPNEHCYVIGINPRFARPEWMILTVLPVAPVCVRPSITLESGIRSEDDLTHKLVDVIRINQRLRENIEAGAPQLIVEDLWELLQYHVTTYFNNEVSGIPPARHRSGRSLRTITQRLKGKEGRFRSNLSGKRVDFSARTVISPDPNLSINEVGVPNDLAMILTVPERVTEWRIEEIKDLVINGPDVHPGANYLIRPDGKRIDLRFVKERQTIADSLKPGYIVERHLVDGDIVLFNRQPSLHRMSIMAHQVKVMPYRTFRLNLTVCPPYNADFDGDEMNLHVPQGEEARAEARTLMRVQEQILSPRYGGPIIGAIQDFITAAYLLTRKNTFLTRREVMQLLIAAGQQGVVPTPIIRRPVELWSGKQLFSLFIPKGLNLSLRAKLCTPNPKCPDCKDCDTDAFVMIRDGQLMTGSIDERAIGAHQADSMLHRVTKDYGADAARQFLDSITRMLIQLITNYGFTVGNDNVTLTDEARRRVRAILLDADKKVDQLIDIYRRGELESLPGRSLEETLEMRIMEVLAEGRDKAGDIAGQYLGLDNQAVIMAKTGARGKALNLAQMAACVGQQSVRGERVQRGYQNRTLSHFNEGDLGAKSRGFVHSSYIDGLNPIEFFFHAMGGREGLVDTAVRTSTSGYLQRRLINALQDVKVEYDKTIREAEGRVIQLRFGDDGVDPSKSDHGKAVNIDIIVEKILAKGGK